MLTRKICKLAFLKNKNSFSFLELADLIWIILELEKNKLKSPKCSIDVYNNPQRNSF